MPFWKKDRVPVEYLLDVGFFADFGDTDLEQVAKVAKERALEAGNDLIEQGRVATECYVITSGTAQVRVADEPVAQIEPGTIVGEMGLVDYSPRNASVRAVSDLEFLAINIADFHKLLDGSPALKERVLSQLATRVDENAHR